METNLPQSAVTERKPLSVTVEDIRKDFGDYPALDGVSLEIAGGELVALLGPSGSGKTTLLRIIAGLEYPTGGTLLFGDVDASRKSVQERNVGFVFQHYALFRHMTVFENIAFGLKVRKRGHRPSRKAIAERVMSLLELVQLDGLEDRYPTQLSGGQRQRVALARALAIRPRVLLFDEPLSNLDAKLRRRVREEIRQLQQDLGITTVYVTHDQEEALAISDRIVVMHNGVLEQVGGPHDLYTAPHNRFVADFIGSASIMKCDYDGHTLRIGEYALEHRQDVPPGTYEVMVRPEAIEFADEGLPATVRSNAYLGPANEYWFDTPHGELFASISGEGRTEYQRGDSVFLRLRSVGVHLLAG